MTEEEFIKELRHMLWRGADALDTKTVIRATGYTLYDFARDTGADNDEDFMVDLGMAVMGS